jgi:acyl carrier protein
MRAGRPPSDPVVNVTANLTQTVSTGPASGTETILAGILAEVLRAGQVSADSHLFDDLGADSLVMAKFCARVRKHEDLPSVSMKDIYRHPTIRSLATIGSPLYNWYLRALGAKVGRAR